MEKLFTAEEVKELINAAVDKATSGEKDQKKNPVIFNELVSLEQINSIRGFLLEDTYIGTDADKKEVLVLRFMSGRNRAEIMIGEEGNNYVSNIFDGGLTRSKNGQKIDFSGLDFGGEEVKYNTIINGAVASLNPGKTDSKFMNIPETIENNEILPFS